VVVWIVLAEAVAVAAAVGRMEAFASAGEGAYRC